MKPWQGLFDIQPKTLVLIILQHKEPLLMNSTHQYWCILWSQNTHSAQRKISLTKFLERNLTAKHSSWYCNDADHDGNRAAKKAHNMSISKLNWEDSHSLKNHCNSDNVDNDNNYHGINDSDGNSVTTSTTSQKSLFVWFSFWYIFHYTYFHYLEWFHS